MKKIWSWLVTLFGGGRKPPPVIVVPEKPKPVEIPVPSKTLNWPDRRPMGMLILSSYTDPYTRSDRNWKLGGVHQFGHAALMAHVDESIKQLKNIDAQAVVVWDIEGQEYPHAISFIGDPTLLHLLAPEMNNYADEVFRRFTDAGLKVGVCLRPTQFKHKTQADYPDLYPAKNPHELDNVTPVWAFHESVADAFENLRRKALYAWERWDCKIFYVDSNVWPGKAGVDCTDGQGGLMTAEIFERLHFAFPDCLFMPEHQNVDYHRFTAPFNDKNYRHDVEPAYKAIVPDAFQVLVIADDTFSQEQLNESVKQGNILMVEAWWPHSQLHRVKQAYAVNK